MVFTCFSGSDDLSAKLWDVRTGQCIYGIQTHTCATVKFDEQKLVTGSFDNTIACWEWSTGAKIQQFRGHTGAGWFQCWAIMSLSRIGSILMLEERQITCGQYRNGQLCMEEALFLVFYVISLWQCFIWQGNFKICQNKGIKKVWLGKKHKSTDSFETNLKGNGKKYNPTVCAHFCTLWNI